MAEAFCCVQAGNTDCYKDANGYWIHNSGHYYWAADHSAAGGSWQPCQAAVRHLWVAQRIVTGRFTLRCRVVPASPLQGLALVHMRR